MVDEGGGVAPTTYYRRWIARLWNGPRDAAALLRSAEAVAAPEYYGHWGNREVFGVDGLAEAVQDIRDRFVTFGLRVVVDPFGDGGMVAARWLAEGVGVDGRAMQMIGHDIMRVGARGIEEHWLAAFPD